MVYLTAYATVLVASLATDVRRPAVVIVAIVSCPSVRPSVCLSVLWCLWWTCTVN